MKYRLFFAVIAVVGHVLPAGAHAFLQHASPAAGTTLAVAPREIDLAFSESLEPAFSTIAVTDTGGRHVEAGNASVRAASMSVGLKPIRPGGYRVHWYAVSVDGHRTEGAYSFNDDPVRVGAPSKAHSAVSFQCQVSSNAPPSARGCRGRRAP